ncbi:MAG: DeoR/GlpR family DNA-binding transcription regulator [Lachnospiraceae bacterium]|nr:DeoR/GlpR family DNA-binding transcription regulator [Lachnospiraceae bacterium]
MSVQELMTLLDASESTIRRDLNDLDKKKLLVKVHGGAVAVSKSITADSYVSSRADLNREKKKKIAQYAAALIGDDDLVYLDAGTTTGFIADYLSCKGTVFVTNAIMHARKLSGMGYRVYMPGGMLKERTEALTGTQTCEYLSRFHFTKGFFGTNGVTVKDGFTTPDIQEGTVKETAIRQTEQRFVLCDGSKFDRVSSVTFAGFSEASVITDETVPEAYRRYDRLIIV